MVAISKGANIPLEAAAVRATLTWTPSAGIDVDVSALLVQADGKVRSDDDFVFYNAPVHGSGAVRHEGKTPGADVISVDLGRVEPAIDRIVIAASADGCTFGQVPGLALKVTDAATGTELADFQMSASSETAFVGGEVYRRQGAWKFRAVGQGYASGLAGLATDFGISVDDTPAPTPTPTPTPPAPAQPSTPQPHAPLPPAPAAPASSGSSASSGSNLLDLDQPPLSSLIPTGPPPPRATPVLPPAPPLTPPSNRAAAPGAPGAPGAPAAPVAPGAAAVTFARPSAAAQAQGGGGTAVLTAPAPAAPAPSAGISLKKQQLISMEKKVAQQAPRLLSLTKSAGVSLEKKGLGEHTARVALCLDISGSMHGLFRSGKVQKLIERILALGLRFDDDGEVDVFLFGQHGHTAGTLNLGSVDNFSTLLLQQHPLEGGTKYAEAMKLIRREYFDGDGPRSTPFRAETPVYVMFVTDGSTNDERATEEQVRSSSYEPVFWQFMAIGESNRGVGAPKKGRFGYVSRPGASDFRFLEALDDLSGRLIDNADFFSVPDPEHIPDDQLFDLLMAEYPTWLAAARSRGLIPGR